MTLLPREVGGVQPFGGDGHAHRLEHFPLLRLVPSLADQQPVLQVDGGDGQVLFVVEHRDRAEHVEPFGFNRIVNLFGDDDVKQSHSERVTA